MHILRGQAVAGTGIGFFDGEGLQEAVEVLHVGDVAAEADDGSGGPGGGEGAEALDVCEAREGAVRGCWGGGWVSWGIFDGGEGGGLESRAYQGCRRR